LEGCSRAVNVVSIHQSSYPSPLTERLGTNPNGFTSPSPPLSTASTSPTSSPSPPSRVAVGTRPSGHPSSCQVARVNRLDPLRLTPTRRRHFGKPFRGLPGHGIMPAQFARRFSNVQRHNAFCGPQNRLRAKQGTFPSTASRKRRGQASRARRRASLRRSRPEVAAKVRRRKSLPLRVVSRRRYFPWRRSRPR
jgi:hypothetical protein